ncbi:MAG: low molecular weight protein-tyrosine-phosphatase [Bacteroidaceae bacterium]
MKILFVCLGNICRSATAQAVMEGIIAQHSVLTELEIDSAGILNYHQGELPDSRMRMHASRRGYELTHRSRPVVTDDFDTFDLIIGMDDRNISDLKEKAPSIEAEQKIHRMTDYALHTVMDHVPDPYYGGASGFELVLDLLEDCCEGLLKHIQASDA